MGGKIMGNILIAIGAILILFCTIRLSKKYKR